ncbi:MAG: SDR family oxidoreductase [Rhodospirillales bacterium]|jgi:NAD(P)-dependent dehydrogenase (short-subunit alcohol dehydrogenase family)|nr:SDR family oxidoreductase [Rhodospirillales bacterium]
MTNEFSGTRVLITAGASGIGAATAKQFLDCGAHVHICDIDEAAVSRFLKENPTATGSITDVSNEQSVDELFETVQQELGGLDVLNNNAGIAGPTDPVEGVSYADWQRCLDVNLGAAFLCARRAIPMLKEAGGGSIINMSSTAGLFGFPNRSPYAAAKWAIIGFTKTLAMELGTDNIRANCICPGSVSGDRMDRVVAAHAIATGETEEAIRTSYTSASSMNTFVSPDDIAASILFLCSKAGNKISGQALPVDGHAEAIQ